MSDAALKHVHNNYKFENYENRWIELIDGFVEKHGSWENRKLYNRWELMEIASEAAK